jgi:hypothetical protein
MAEDEEVASANDVVVEAQQRSMECADEAVMENVGNGSAALEATRVKSKRQAREEEPEPKAAKVRWAQRAARGTALWKAI